MPVLYTSGIRGAFSSILLNSQTDKLSKMPSYKVTYFNIKGLGEPIRWMFAYAGVQYEDKRVVGDEWKALKSTMPFGQLPVLEVDGKKINQSTAICRYLAKQFGLTGKDDWENLEIDAIVDTIIDLRTAAAAVLHEKVPEAKAEKQKVADEKSELIINRLDEQVKSNGGYLVGGKITWADIMFVSMLELIKHCLQKDVIEKAEHLKALREKVLAVPGIKAWVEKRPASEF